MNTPNLPEPAGVAKRPTFSDPEALHAHFLCILPRIETHARIAFRHLRCPGKRDDAVAEVVAVAWKWYLRLGETGKDIDGFVTTFADYAVRHVRSGRRLCGQARAKDAFSPLAQARHGFRVESLVPATRDGYGSLYSAPHGQGAQDAYEERLRDNTTTPPPDQAAFRIDWPGFLATLGTRDRAIIRDMACDLGTGELADRHRVSPARISQLRREFRDDYRRFHGEPAAC